MRTIRPMQADVAADEADEGVVARGGPLVLHNLERRRRDLELQARARGRTLGVRPLGHGGGAAVWVDADVCAGGDVIGVLEGGRELRHGRPPSGHVLVDALQDLQADCAVVQRPPRILDQLVALAAANGLRVRWAAVSWAVGAH